MVILAGLVVGILLLANVVSVVKDFRSFGFMGWSPCLAIVRRFLRRRTGIGLFESAQDHEDGPAIRIVRVCLDEASGHARHLMRVLALGRADAEHTRIIRVAEQGGAQDSREVSQTEPGSGRIRNLNAQALHAAIVFDLSARLEQPARGQFCLSYGRARNMKGAAEQDCRGPRQVPGAHCSSADQG